MAVTVVANDPLTLALSREGTGVMGMAGPLYQVSRGTSGTTGVLTLIEADGVPAFIIAPNTAGAVLSNETYPA